MDDETIWIYRTFIQSTQTFNFNHWTTPINNRTLSQSKTHFKTTYIKPYNPLIQRQKQNPLHSSNNHRLRHWSPPNWPQERKLIFHKSLQPRPHNGTRTRHPQCHVRDFIVYGGLRTAIRPIRCTYTCSGHTRLLIRIGSVGYGITYWIVSWVQVRLNVYCARLWDAQLIPLWRRLYIVVGSWRVLMWGMYRCIFLIKVCLFI